MIEISLSNIQKTFGYNNILKNINFDIKTGDKVSLIGENGCGKTTILELIIGNEVIDSGNITIRKGSTIGYLSQNQEIIYNNRTVKEIIYTSLKEINDINKLMNKYEKMMINKPNDISVINKYLKFQEKFISIGGYEIDTKIEKIANAFKIKNFFDKDFNELSGGEQKRVLLASIIIQNPNILILDEPTNHLDIDTIEWLEIYLNNYKGTILIVSHDRYFLNKICNKTILIENGKSIIFPGNYSFYLKENEKRLEKEFIEYKDQQKLISAMKKKIKQLEDFGRLAYPGGEPFYRRAENIRKRLNRLELIDKPVEKKELPIDLIQENRSSKDVLVIKDYDLYIKDKLLIKDINIIVNYGDKVCILGNNGTGKSTLIKQIINNKEFLGSNLKIGYIPQIIEFDNDITVYDYARKFYIGEESHLRSALSKFYFYGKNVFKKVNSLSGGEKVRLKLFELINNNSNFIILDEPTNHLDIYTKETLENSLKDYKGTLLFISHDRFFINEIANKILFINNNRLKEYVGNYDFFKEHYLEKNTNN